MNTNTLDLLKKKPKLESHLGDIRDKDSVRNCFDNLKFDVVINTALKRSYM